MFWHLGDDGVRPWFNHAALSVVEVPLGQGQALGFVSAHRELEVDGGAGLSKATVKDDLTHVVDNPKFGFASVGEFDLRGLVGRRQKHFTDHDFSWTKGGEFVAAEGEGHRQRTRLGGGRFRCLGGVEGRFARR